MKKSEIRIGGYYTIRVGGEIVTLRVDAVEEGTIGRGRVTPAYRVTLSTGRKITFRSVRHWLSPKILDRR